MSGTWRRCVALWMMFIGVNCQDTCVSDCIWVADGTLSGSTCGWLTDPASGVYENRKFYCSKNLAPGCTATCEIVNNDPSATMRPDPPRPTTSTPVPTCVDSTLGVYVLDSAMPCSFLTMPDPADRMGVYQGRHSICKMATTNCCASCAKVNAEVTEPPCVDSTYGIHILDGSYPCSYLTTKNSHDNLGIYNSRSSICQQSLTQCCASCKQVAAETCEDTALGINILDGSYPCDYLTTKNRYDNLGIYSSRKSICQQPLTKCCASCKQVAAETCEDSPNGIHMEGNDLPCKYLTGNYTEDAMFKVYENRRAVCGMGTTQCCASCKIVADEFSTTTTTVSTTTPTSTSRPTPRPVQDTCVTDCLWVADGTEAGSTCGWLLDPSSSVYSFRQRLCRGGFASGCKATCSIVLANAEVPSAPQVQTTTTTQAIVCNDGYLRISKSRMYACSELVRPLSDIYSDRVALCTRFGDECCITCTQVRAEKPSNEIKYNGQNNANAVSSSNDVASDVINDAPQVQVSMSNVMNIFKQVQDSFKRIIQEQEAEKQKVNVFFSNFHKLFSRAFAGRR